MQSCRHHHNGRWEARIGRVFGNKYLYLGTYSEYISEVSILPTQQLYTKLTVLISFVKRLISTS